jgi:hypothetical protein
MFYWGHTEEELKSASRQTKQLRRLRMVTKTFMPIHMAHEMCLSMQTCFSRKNQEKLIDSIWSNSSQDDAEGKTKHHRTDTQETIDLSSDCA